MKRKLEKLIIASIETLKRGNKKCENQEVFNVVRLGWWFIVQKQSIKRLQVSDKLTTDQKSVDCSQATVQSSQLIEDTCQATVQTLCSETFIQSNFEGALNL